jgi:hypothetical protein
MAGSADHETAFAVVDGIDGRGKAGPGNRRLKCIR